MDELLGTIRPVKHLGGKAQNIEPLGEFAGTVRYVEDDQIVRVIDETRLPFVDDAADADGFGLFAEDGTLMSWWMLIAPPGDELTLSGGWGFRMTPAIDLAAAEERDQTLVV